MSCDVLGSVRPGLAKLKEAFIAQTRELNDECIVGEQNNQDANEERERREDELASLEDKYARLGQQYEREKETANSKLKAANSEADGIEVKLEKTMAACHAELQASEADARAAEHEYNRVLDQCHEEREETRQRVLSAMDTLSAHKNHIMQSLKTTLHRVKEVAAETKQTVSR
jgi:SMC interacting uncharacterized protein involved in chromosome segregation